MNANLYAVSAIPAGLIAPFGGLNPPAGWLVCNGSVVSVATYAGLHDAIGDVWNTGGEGGGNFRLPDLQGRAPIGAGQGPGLTNRTIGTTLGEEAHTLNLNEMPAHN